MKFEKEYLDVFCNSLFTTMKMKCKDEQLVTENSIKNKIFDNITNIAFVLMVYVTASDIFKNYSYEIDKNELKDCILNNIKALELNKTEIEQHLNTLDNSNNQKDKVYKLMSEIFKKILNDNGRHIKYDDYKIQKIEYSFKLIYSFVDDLLNSLIKKIRKKDIEEERNFENWKLRQIKNESSENDCLFDIEIKLKNKKTGEKYEYNVRHAILLFKDEDIMKSDLFSLVNCSVGNYILLKNALLKGELGFIKKALDDNETISANYKFINELLDFETKQMKDKRKLFDKYV